MASQLDLFISVGEVSGDLLAHSVVSNLPKTWKIGGIIGPKLREIGVEELFPMEIFEIHGFYDLFKALPRILRARKKIRDTILAFNPQAVLFVDNSEFSRMMARLLRKEGYKGKIIQLVCPSIWAWRKHRKKDLVQNVDLLLCLFPFEKELFNNTSLQVEFIGHPIVQKWFQLLPTPTLDQSPVFAVFPGSRKREILQNFPIQLQAIKRLQGLYQAHISLAHEKYRGMIEQLLKKEGVTASLVLPEDKEQLLKKTDLALSKCGTITLELAAAGVPTIVMYKMNWVDIIFGFFCNLFLAHYSLPNILLGKRIFPEYLGLYAKEPLILEEVARCARNPHLKQEMKKVRKELKRLFGEREPGKLAADKIQNLIFIPS